jgi:hypothetical protein
MAIGIMFLDFRVVIELRKIQAKEFLMVNFMD